MVHSPRNTVANDECAAGIARLVASAVFAHLYSNAGATNVCKLDCDAGLQA